MFWRAITSPEALGVLRNPPGKSISIVQRGTTTGRLLGGNLSLMTALLGTPYFPLPSPSIFALEDVDEPVYKIDRMLHHMVLAGMFSRRNWFVFGDIRTLPADRGKPSLTLRQVFTELLSSIRTPCMAGFHFGHVRRSLTIPMGVTARLTTGRRALEILEPAVR